MPHERSKTIEEQISELEAQKSRIRGNTGDGQKALARIEMQIQQLRNFDKRKD